MKQLLIMAVLEPFRIVSDFFNNDAHSIISKRGLEILDESDENKNS